MQEGDIKQVIIGAIYITIAMVIGTPVISRCLSCPQYLKDHFLSAGMGWGVGEGGLDFLWLGGELCVQAVQGRDP